MKVTVKNYLNVRVGKPSVNAPCYQYLAPGSELEVDGTLYTGDFFEGSNKWFRDGADNYYWAGGITSSTVELRNLGEATKPFDFLFNYNKIVQTKTPLPTNQGSGIHIAILDSGVEIRHKDLTGAVVDSKSFIEGLSPTHDVWGHGTLMAGLIGARSSDNKGIVGVAPQCKIFNYRVCDDDGAVNMNALKNAFNFILSNQKNLQIHIINLSISVSDLSFVDTELNALHGLGIKLVVAAGNEGMFKNNLVRLLAQNTNTIAVGVINNKTYVTNTGIIPTRLSCFYFNQSQFSCSSNPIRAYEEAKGDSVYTAITSGIHALLMNTQSTINSYCFIKELFNTNGLKPFTPLPT